MLAFLVQTQMTIKTRTYSSFTSLRHDLHPDGSGGRAASFRAEIDGRSGCLKHHLLKLSSSLCIAYFPNQRAYDTNS